MMNVNMKEIFHMDGEISMRKKWCSGFGQEHFQDVMLVMVRLMNILKTLLWWSKGGILRGESPARIAFLKEFLADSPSFDNP